MDILTLPSPSPRPSPLGRGSSMCCYGFKSMAQDLPTHGVKWFTLSPRERDGVRGKGARATRCFPDKPMPSKTITHLLRSRIQSARFLFGEISPALETILEHLVVRHYFFASACLHVFALGASSRSRNAGKSSALWHHENQTHRS